MKRQALIDMIADLYEEIGINELGFDPIDAIKKLGINVVPYSSFEKRKNLFLNFDEDGFNFINPKTNKIVIIYNDEIYPKARIKFTLPHELGHICSGHNLQGKAETAWQKHEANEFAREFYCPQAFILYYGLKTTSDLVSAFGITQSYAKVLLDKLKKRTDRTLSKEERRLIEIFENNKNKK